MGKKIGGLLLLLAIASLALSACSGGTPQPPKQQPCPTPDPTSPDAVSAITEPSIYMDKNSYVKTVIFRDVPPTSPELSAQLKRRGLAVLVSEVSKWSVSKNVDGDEGLRITVVFIHPELLHAIFWNDLIYHNVQNLKDFEYIVQTEINKWESSKELMFLVVMTTKAGENNAALLSIDVSSMNLRATHDPAATPTHSDTNLSAHTLAENGKKAGFVMFPAMYLQNQNCMNVFTVGKDTSLYLSAASLKINDRTISNLGWEWLFPLVAHDNSIPGNRPSYDDLSKDAAEFKPSVDIPYSDDADFEFNLARFVWYRIMELSRYP